MIKIKSLSLKRPYVISVSVAIVILMMFVPFMGEINSYVFIFAFLLLPIVIGIRLFRKVKATNLKWITCFVVSMILGYVFIVLSALSIDWYYEYELNQYDFDGDGMFSADEISPEMEKAMSRLTNDTGRTLVPITAGIVSPLYNGCWLVFFHFLTDLRHRIATKKRTRGSSKAPMPR